MELRTNVLPFWESMKSRSFEISKAPSAMDISDRRWMARRLATLGIVSVNGLTSLGSMGLKRLGIGKKPAIHARMKFTKVERMKPRGSQAISVQSSVQSPTLQFAVKAVSEY